MRIKQGLLVAAENASNDGLDEILYNLFGDKWELITTRFEYDLGDNGYKSEKITYIRVRDENEGSKFYKVRQKILILVEDGGISFDIKTKIELAPDNEINEIDHIFEKYEAERINI